MKKECYIYFLTNQHHTVLYIGVTNDVVRRVVEHKAGINQKSFTFQYNCDKLVYYEAYTQPKEAIAREKQLKNWKREWKDELIKGFNPQWEDLSREIGITPEMVESLRKDR